MASTIPDKKAIKAEIEADPRNISAVWTEAITEYNTTANEDKKTADGVLTTRLLSLPNYKDTRAMKAFGEKEAQKFDKFRDSNGKIDKVRKLFMQNIDFIEAGSKQILGAVNTSFPPAVVISTAMTFVLSAFRSVSADYDVVANFFEDMNNFLNRVTIIAERVPRKEAYRMALIDVFTAMLSLCGAARQYIVLGRFKKWVINSVFGDDSALKGGRQRMDTCLARLQYATELTILDNTENMLEQQAEMGTALSKLRRELDRNGELHEQIAANQNAATEKISKDVQTMMRDLKLLLSFQQEANSSKNQSVPKVDEPSANVVRHFYEWLAEKGVMGETREEPFPDMPAVLANLEKSRVEGTGSWLFGHPTWLAWTDSLQSSATLLWLEGDPGMGKTYLSLAAYHHFRGISEPEQEVCTAYFSCRKTDNQRKSMKDLLRNCAIQIADQSPTIRQRLEAMWRSYRIVDRVTSSNRRVLDSGTVDNDIFIYENFSKSSGSQLFVVIDGIDQFETDEIDRFFEIVHQVQEQQLQIKFLVAVRLTDKLTIDKLNMFQSQKIHIGRDEILSDVQKILWKGINSEDSAYGGLRKLSKQSKQQLAQRIKENSDNLLYVDQTLLFVANAIREGNTENLLDSVPINLTDLYATILGRSLQSFSPDTIRSLKSIVVWLTFAHEPLTLDWLGLLAESFSLSSEQILSFVLQFFEVDIISKDAATLLDIDFTELFDNSIDISKGNVLAGNSLRLQLKNRATEDFFNSADPHDALRTSSASDAHRILFTSTADIILQPKTGNKPLQEYAIEHCLNHWSKIVPEEHTEDEQIEICRKFVLLIGDDCYAEGLSEHPRVNGKKDILPSGWEDAWFHWSSLVHELNMADEELECWQLIEMSLYPLVTALVRCWLKTIDTARAIRAWELAKSISGIADASRLAHAFAEELTDAQADLAIGSVLALPEPYQLSSAIQKLRPILAKSQNAALRTRCYVQLALVCTRAAHWNDVSVEHGRLEDGVEYCRLILEGKETLQPSTRAEVLCIQGLIMKFLGENVEAAESLGEARQLSTDTIPAQQLFDELLCLNEYPVLMTDRLLSFSPIDRFRFVTGKSEVGEAGHTTSVPHERMILPASAQSHKSDGIVEMYREIIKALDAEGAAAPIRVDLARILWRLRYNIKPQTQKSQLTGDAVDGEHASGQQDTSEDLKKKPAVEIAWADVPNLGRGRPRDEQSSAANAFNPVKEAKFLLNQVLDSVSEGRTHELTDRDPLSVANSALLLITDILLEEFRTCKKIEDKVQVLLQAKELPRRKLIVSQPLIIDDIWNQYNTAVAHMLRKVGPMSEYEQVMNNIFDKATTGLNDDARLNDHFYLTAISRIFMLEPRLREFGKMVMTAQWDEGTYPCDGICIPVVVYDGNDSLDPYYQCLVCTNTKLCPKCHETRMRWNKDPTTRKPTDVDFCCPNGQYMKIPVQHYSEPVRIPQEPKELTAYLKQVWKEAWEDIASGI